MQENQKPLRVLQVVGKMERSGYESRIMDIYRNMDRSQVQFDFYTHRDEKGDFDDEIVQLGGKIYYNDAISPFRFLKYLGRLNRFFKENSYDIVHAHLNSYCAWVLFAAKRNDTKVRIAHSRNCGFDPGWKTIFKRASKIFVNMPPTHRFACSKKAGVWLFGKKFLTDKNSKVIPNAFNCDAFAFSEDTRNEVRTELGISSDTLAIVNVGRLSSPKNHHKVFSVFKTVLEKNSDSELYLFGDGELKEELHNLAIEMNLKDKIHFMGNRPNVNRYLNGMDVMLFPSIYEGFGTVAIEAQANGLPVIASDVLPEETRLTDIIKYFSLEDKCIKWANAVTQITNNIERSNYSEIVKRAGYDMRINGKNMQDFYIDSIK